MKKYRFLSIAVLAVLCTGGGWVMAHWQMEPYILQHDAAIARPEPGPHNGGGETIAYPYFEGTRDYKLTFRKRTLKPGATIGYHEQRNDEIYYVLEGKGTLIMNGKPMQVNAGDAILTRPGSSHGLKADLGEPITIFIVY